MNAYSDFTAFGMAAMLCIASLTACSQKPSTEEIGAQVKIAMEQAENDKQTAAVQAAQTPQSSAAVKPRKTVLATRQARLPAESAKPACTNCGVVLAVNVIEVEGKGSGAGVVAGGVVGGLVGHQVGDGTGRDLATFAGVIGGAIAGNKIEKKTRKTMNYDIMVKMDDGLERTYRQIADPDMVKGQKVKIENDVVVKN